MTRYENVNNPRRKATAMGWPLFLVTTLGALAAAGYFASKGDWVGLAFVLVMFFGCITGFHYGAASFLASLLGLAVASHCAPALGTAYEHEVANWFHTSGIVNRVLSIGLAGVAIVIVVTLFVKLVTSMMFYRVRGLDFVNRWAGMIIGTIQGAVAALLLTGGILTVAPELPTKADGAAKYLKLRDLVVESRNAIGQSQLAPAIEKYNPFECIPELRELAKVQKTVLELKQPDTIRRVMTHPRIRQMQSRTAEFDGSDMRKAVDRLLSDPSVVAYVRNGKPLDQAAAVNLMSHPAFLQLVEQPGFLEEANRIIAEVGSTPSN